MLRQRGGEESEGGEIQKNREGKRESEGERGVVYILNIFYV